MEKILESAQKALDNRNQELAIVRQRIEKWEEYERNLENLQFSVENSSKVIDVSDVFVERICDSLQAMTVEAEANLVKEKEKKRQLVAENVRIEKQSKMLNQWISTNVKKYDRLLDRIQKEKDFIQELRQQAKAL